MIDTVVLQIKQYDFQITNYEKFRPNCLGFFAAPYTPFSGQTNLKSVQNPTKQDRENNNYKPRLTVIKRLGRQGGFEISLKIEFSIPKLLYGNNFQEVEEEDFEKIVFILQQKFEKMLKLVKESPDTIAIITDTVDRLQRSFKESVELDSLRKEGKIELHFNRENLVIHKESNSSEIMRWDMAVMFAKMYVLQLSDNIKRSNKKKWELGEWCGAAPIGYKNVLINGQKDIVLDEERAPLIKKCFELYASGNSTFKRLAKIMKEDGLTTPRSGNRRTKGQIQEMIANPFYYGEMNVKGKLYKHNYPPIIEKWIFDKCENIREDRNTSTIRYNSKEFSFRGILKCAYCQGTITLDETVKPSGKVYRYCKCPNSKGTCCGQKPIRVEELQKQIYELLDSLIMPKHILEEIILELKKGQKNEAEIYKNNLNRLYLELEKIKKRKDTIYLDRLDGRITTDEYDNIVARFQAEEIDVQEEIKEASRVDNRFLESSLNVLELSQRAGELFDESSKHKKQKLLNLVTSNLHLKDGELVYDLRTPFDVLLNLSKTKDWYRR